MHTINEAQFYSMENSILTPISSCCIRQFSFSFITFIIASAISGVIGFPRIWKNTNRKNNVQANDL